MSNDAPLIPVPDAQPRRPNQRRAAARGAELELVWLIDEVGPPGNVVRALAALLLGLAERELNENGET